jgi:hypothetical protein
MKRIFSTLIIAVILTANLFAPFEYSIKEKSFKKSQAEAIEIYNQGNYAQKDDTLIKECLKLNKKTFKFLTQKFLEFKLFSHYYYQAYLSVLITSRVYI